MNCTEHESHAHAHGAGCGHQAVQHEDHVDYLHDGHLHHPHHGHTDEHSVSGKAACKNGHSCQAHPAGHQHGEGCGHPSVPHGEHQDYLVEGHLHHAHDGHCDHHGALAKA